ncbi:hypothetical protein [uncultured Methanobrevibacter sp.]|uniref:hypothetical protein n=1 Tax=uncultured Methanobrevibacter sp. TaxID=253161 RepID=UPI0025CE5842|nr:hypothetical protein [uncultured Methanobrevibacter sp.]
MGNELFRTKAGYSIYQKMLIYLSSLILLICLLLEYMVFKNISDYKFFTAVFFIALIYIYFSSKSEAQYNRSDALLSIVLSIGIILIGVYYYYKINFSMLITFFISSIISLIAFIPHAKKHKTD